MNLGNYNATGFEFARGYLSEDDLAPIHDTIGLLVHREADAIGGETKARIDALSKAELPHQGLFALRDKHPDHMRSVVEKLNTTTTVQSLLFGRKLAELAAAFTNADHVEEVGFTNHMVRVDLPAAFNAEKMRFSLPWHQDGAYYPRLVSHKTSIVLSIALFPCHRENGCVEIMPGSHLKGLVEHKRSYRDPVNKKHLREEVFPEEYGFSEVAYLETDPGDVAVMHFNAFHRSGHNETDRVRYTLLVRATNTADPAFVL